MHMRKRSGLVLAIKGWVGMLICFVSRITCNMKDKNNHGKYLRRLLEDSMITMMMKSAEDFAKRSSVVLVSSDTGEDKVEQPRMQEKFEEIASEEVRRASVRCVCV